ncbi:transposase [Aeromonas caviae]|nr:transposase [Aeromonas caviae]
MSHQLTFADSELSSKRRQTRKEIFLSRMEHILPWQDMPLLSSRFIPKPVMVVGPIRWKPCYAFTACSIGTT